LEVLGYTDRWRIAGNPLFNGAIWYVTLKSTGLTAALTIDGHDESLLNAGIASSAHFRAVRVN